MEDVNKKIIDFINKEVERRLLEAIPTSWQNAFSEIAKRQRLLENTINELSARDQITKKIVEAYDDFWRFYIAMNPTSRADKMLLNSKIIALGQKIDAYQEKLIIDKKE